MRSARLLTFIQISSIAFNRTKKCLQFETISLIVNIIFYAMLSTRFVTFTITDLHIYLSTITLYFFDKLLFGNVMLKCTDTVHRFCSIPSNLLQ